MPRKPKTQIKRRASKEDWRIHYLLHGELPEGMGKSFEAFLWTSPNGLEDRRKYWNEVKKNPLSEWIHNRPCTRPWAWFEFDAPRQDDKKTNWYWHGTLPEERLKVGGGGKKTALSYSPKYKFAVFKYWDFDGEPPPLFESEAVYLERLELLTSSEKKHLERHPKVRDPVSFYDIFGEGWHRGLRRKLPLDWLTLCALQENRRAINTGQDKSAAYGIPYI